MSELEPLVPEMVRTNFVSLLWQAVVTDSHTSNPRPAYDYEIPDYWAVYGRCHTGEAQWLADCDSQLIAFALLAMLEHSMAIPVEGATLHQAGISHNLRLMNVPSFVN